MKSQSNDYPVMTRYDGDHLAVPINIAEISIPNQMGDPQAGYEYDLLIVQATNPYPDTVADKKTLINTICQAIILARFTLIYQANVANGLYPDNGMKQWIADMVTESNRCTDLLALNQPAVPVWPIYVEVE